jgi:DHA2 family multidrug resistance protein
MATIVAPVLGPTLGGIITDQLDWRWIFFLNVPIGIVAVILVSALVEDPPWVKSRRSHGIDYIGLGLISLGLGCLEVMLDRGEDDDWFSSPFIQIMAFLAIAGIVGSIIWLSVAKRPIVHIDVFKDRNFAVACVMIAFVGALLYASAVMIPQMAQQYLSYDATWSGLILSPGGILMIMLIPIVGRVLKLVAARYLVAIGFTIMGFAFLYSSHLTQMIDFPTLMGMRMFQTSALAFLFVPISTVAYLTLPRERNGDGVALFAMFRNVFGSVGISLSTAHVTESAQRHTNFLSEWATPFHQPFNNLVSTYSHALVAAGQTAQAAHDMALGRVLQTIRTQAAIMAYADTFVWCAVAAFAVVPLTFLMTSKKSGGGPGAAH